MTSNDTAPAQMLTAADRAFLASYSTEKDFIFDAAELQPTIRRLLDRGLLVAAPHAHPGHRLTETGAAALHETTALTGRDRP